LNFYKMYKTRSVDSYNYRIILDALAKGYDFVLPPSVYIAEFSNVTKFFYDHLPSNFNEVSDKMVNLCKKIAKRRVKLRFIIDKICEDFKINIEKKDFEKYISENVDDTRNLNKIIKEEAFVKKAIESIKESKCIKLIFEKAKDTIKTVDHSFIEKDLRKILLEEGVEDDVSDCDEALKIFSHTAEDSDDK
jgi:FKBP-type peptidyl-prolyl cis-trans isomerase (trigger factor)